MIGHLIAVEGPDGAGKDTFVSGLYEFLDQYVKFLLDEQTPKAFFFKPDQERILKRVPNIWPDDYSSLKDAGVRVKFMNLREGSSYAKAFMESIHNGVITDPGEIAKGYLKLHWDYHKRVLEALSEYDLVIMNRSLMSFEALQLRTLKVEGVFEQYQKLVQITGQENIPHYVLLPPKDTVKQRASSKNVSVLDTFFTERLDQTYSAYTKIALGKCHNENQPQHYPLWEAECVDVVHFNKMDFWYMQIVNKMLTNSFKPIKIKG